MIVDDTVFFLGASDAKYGFTVCEYNEESIMFRIPGGQGVYIFAKLDLVTFDYEPLYIGEAANIRQRTIERTHEKLRAAVDMGMEYICVMPTPGHKESQRIEIETDLIDHHRPPLNEEGA